MNLILCLYNSLIQFYHCLTGLHRMGRRPVQIREGWRCWSSLRTQRYRRKGVRGASQGRAFPNPGLLQQLGTRREGARGGRAPGLVPGRRDNLRPFWVSEGKIFYWVLLIRTLLVFISLLLTIQKVDILLMWIYYLFIIKPSLTRKLCYPAYVLINIFGNP